MAIEIDKKGYIKIPLKKTNRKNSAKRVEINVTDKKKDKSIKLIYTLIFIMIIFIVYLSINSLILIPNEIDKVKNDLNAIRISNEEINNQVSELSKSLMETRTNLSKQIGIIKAGTSSDFSSVIETAVNSVVSIRTNIAQGTGFIITPDGYVVTNAHVLSGAKYADAIMSSQEVNSMDLIGYNLTLDLALLKINGDFDYLYLGNSDESRVGEKVIAIGNPLGLSFSVSEGIISGVNRQGTNELPYYIQTDAALNPGNSGGPLIGTNGYVLGINNFKARGESIGFALESNYIKEGINEIALRKLNRTIL